MAIIDNQPMRICIDFGTAFSKAALFLGGATTESEAVAPLPIGAASGAEHALLTPSAMYVEDGRVFFGPAALERALVSGDAKRLPILSFKMVLSARELEPTLALKVSRFIDPSSVLRHRDCLVLYLAYLDQLVRMAVAAEPNLPPSAAAAPWRITSPLWRSQGEASATIGSMVEQARSVSALLGVDIVDPNGIAFARVKQALDACASAPARGRFEGIVFEAHSAASAYAAFSASRAPFVLVIDMGAGTTDIAGFELTHDSTRARMREIVEVRQWCTLAGDEIDGILIDLLMRGVGTLKREDEARLWRGLRLSTHRLKRELFLKGKTQFEHRRRRYALRLETLMHDPSFKSLSHALGKAFASGLAPLFERARRARAASVTVLLAGGGSSMLFLAELVRRAAARVSPSVKLQIEPFGANWSFPHGHHPFNGVFPQMAIAMGGALAPLGEVVTLEPQPSF